MLLGRPASRLFYLLVLVLPPPPFPRLPPFCQSPPLSPNSIVLTLSLFHVLTTFVPTISPSLLSIPFYPLLVSLPSTMISDSCGFEVPSEAPRGCAGVTLRSRRGT